MLALHVGFAGPVRTPRFPSMAAETTTMSIDDVLSLIRPAVRNQGEYVVDHPSGIDVKLNQNESPFDLPDEIKEELLDAFGQVEFNRYPSEQPEGLRRALAEHEGVSPEHSSSLELAEAGNAPAPQDVAAAD